MARRLDDAWMKRPTAFVLHAIRMVSNAFVDIRYGGLLSINLTKWRTRGLIDWDNADYAALDRVFAGRISESDVIVDVGCRKGRPVNWLLSRGLKNRIIGIELDEEIAEETRRRLRNYSNVSIITGDALENIPPDATLFYLYNPFGASVMRGFKDRLLEELGDRSDITVIYYNCVHVGVFQEDPRWAVEVISIGGSPYSPYGEVAIIRPEQRDGFDAAAKPCTVKEDGHIR